MFAKREYFFTHLFLYVELFHYNMNKQANFPNESYVLDLLLFCVSLMKQCHQIQHQSNEHLKRLEKKVENNINALN